MENKKQLIQEFLRQMLESRQDFLPFDLALQINIPSRMSYIGYIEETESGYEGDVNEVVEELRDLYGYDFWEIKEFAEEFERPLCTAPTYIDLLKWLDEH